MNDTEPPNLTINVYRTFTGQYYPIQIGSNGDRDEKLAKFSNQRHILGTYEIKPDDFNVFWSLWEDSFKRSERFVKRRIDEFIANFSKRE